MNSVHDCGGDDGFGRIIPDAYDGTEPVFKSEWERRMCALFMATIVGGLFTDEDFRQSRERLEPSRYLTRSYYEQWWFAVARLMVEKGVISPAEYRAEIARMDAGTGTGAEARS
ncbi:nitrile hydratase subunit beta [Ancylobacter mangrovi]|uniref:nitrile hydratase subunit beta n=1 Tax=Ancylobacter mangrovi TaxID=2972472 RepID=UPI002163AECE|nr:nitrile hydratase subunit beta [Ancylobacter mangrovi]MCS0502727.1 nitrile hydratase subunit beta [Ancylobacter mangrovi]